MRFVLVLAGIVLFAAQPLFAAVSPASGLVSIVNLSDDHCIPCKMMTRLVEKLQAEYEGRVATVTIDALEDRAVAEKYSVKTMPTLLFFNRRGEEALRHVGVMDEAAMRKVLDDLLAK